LITGPNRPDKIKTKGNVEQKLIQLACAAPPWAISLDKSGVVCLDEASKQLFGEV
jgi:hypothetical protein